MHPLCFSSSHCGTTPLAVGSNARPTLVDWHNRAEPDLLVAHGAVGEGQVTLFRVAGRDDEGLPVYDVGLHIPHFGAAEAISAWPNRTGSRFDLMVARDNSLWRYPNIGSSVDPWFGDPAECPLPLEVRSLGTIVGMCRADIDGDGVIDLIIGVWSDADYVPRLGDGDGPRAVGQDVHGRDIARDQDGTWLGGPMHGHVLWLKNHGSITNPDLALGGPLLLNGRPLDLHGPATPVVQDWDSDGRPELVTTDPLGRICILRERSPKHGLREVDDPVPLGMMEAQGETGFPGRHPAISSADLNGDLHEDLVVGTRDGSLFAIQAVVGPRSGAATLRPPEPLRSNSLTMHLGEAPVPVAADLDGDGDLDLVVGTADGFVYFIENTGSSTAPQFAPPVALVAGDGPICIQAGPEGTLAGPADRGRGFVCPEVIDWDGDGRLDLIVNDYRGHLTLFRNVGTRQEPVFAPGEAILKGDKPFRSVWRVRPTCVDWDGNGLPDLIALDDYGFLNLYRRDGAGLKPGRRLPDQLGRPIQLDGSGAACGRTSLCACDWDGDGDTDLFVGITRFNAHAVQNLAAGAAGLEPPPSVLLLENVGTVEEPVFAPRVIRLKEGPLRVGLNACSPHAASWSGGTKPDLIIGSDDGRIYYVGADEWDT